jgi:serine acetyltransferase
MQGVQDEQDAGGIDMLTKLTVLALFGLDFLAAALAWMAGMDGILSICLVLLGSHIAVSVLIMRLLIGFFPVQEGEFEEGSDEVDRWQARAFLGCLSVNYFDQFVPIFLRAQWYMLFGAKLQWSTKVAGRILDGSLVEMGPNAILGYEGLIMGHFQVDRKVRIGKVRVGESATVGGRASLFPGVTVEPRATVGYGALVLAGRCVPAGETWAGMPAKRIGGMKSEECRMQNADKGAPASSSALGSREVGTLVDA